MQRGRKRNTMDDFWSRVDVRGDDECWEWKSNTNNDGYGRFCMDYKILKAHRVALSTVQDVPDDMCVLHSCDNPSCCNPAHLSVGTQTDNMRDRDQKRRHRPPRGERVGSAKLIECEVHFIRHSDIKQHELAKIFGVTPVAISNIKTRKTWKHVP